MSDEPTTQTDEAIDRPPRDNLVRIVPDMSFRAVLDEEDRPDGRLGTLVGRLVTFDQWAEVNSPMEGRFMERSAPGAFTKTFAENRSRMQVIFDHGMDKAIGRKPLGPLEKVDETDTTITYEAALLDTSYNRDLLPGLRAGLYGSSWRMTAIKSDFKPRGMRSSYNPSGLPEVTIREAKIIELGPTPFPVYAGTTAGLRSMTDEFFLARLAGEPQLVASLLAQAGIALPTPEPVTATPAQSRAVTATPRRFHSDDEWLTYLQEMTAQ